MSEKWLTVIQELYGQSQTYDPFEIAEQKDIEVLFVPFGETPKGETVRFKDETLILLNESLYDTSERYFVLGHELYHALEHDTLSAYYTTQRNGKGTLEREANLFSGHLMVQLYEENYGFPPETFQDLQHLYGVSEEVEDYLTN